MARQTFENWVPEEWGGAVITKVQETSAVESLARREPMGSDTKHVPRSAGMAFTPVVAKGGTYTEATGTNDEILLTALKFGIAYKVADEDLKDVGQVANIIATKNLEQARGYAIGFDHACLGVTAVGAGTAAVPYSSLFYSLNTTNAATGYTADANIITTAGAMTYADVSNAFGLVESGDFYSEGDQVVIAHPSFKQKLRDLVDSQSRPIFQEYQVQGGAPVHTLFGTPIRWTLGARAQATNVQPTGSPLLFVGNSKFLVVGDRSGIEYMVIPGDQSMTDEHTVKIRRRVGFSVANENAFACIEYTAS